MEKDEILNKGNNSLHASGLLPVVSHGGLKVAEFPVKHVLERDDTLACGQNKSVVHLLDNVNSGG